MTPLTCAAAAILLAMPLTVHADALTSDPITFSTKLVYPNGKPAVDAQAIIDLIDIKTKAVTTYTYKPAPNGQITVTIGQSKRTVGVIAFYATSPTGFGLICNSPPNTTSISILQAFTTVRIRLIDAAGKPISNIHVFPREISEDNDVSSWRPWIPGTWNQTTDANGYATFTKLPQNCRLSVDVTDNQYAQPDSKSTIKLAASSVTPDATVQLKAGAAVSGTVQFVSTGTSVNKPVAGLQIEARSDPGHYRFGVTDATGSYTITRLGEGTYQLTATDPHKVAVGWFGNAQSISVAAGVNQSNVNISMVHGGLITGKVTDKVTGKPVPNIDVYAPVPGASSFPGDMTNADGAYSFHIAPGTHDLHLSIPYVGGDLATPRHVDIAEEETQTIDFQIDTPITPAVVQGTVLNPQGKPVPEAQVDAIDDRRGMLTVKTNASGRFTFDSPGLMPNAVIRARSGVLATSDVYTLGGQKDITLRLAPGMLCSLTGYVTDKKGAPLPNAPVNLSIGLAESNYPLTTTVTDAHGKYVFAQTYGNSTYAILTDPSGYATGYSEDIKTTTGENVQVPAMALKVTDSFVGGTLLDAKGSPVANATISDDWRQSVNTKTDKAGHFMLKGLATGRVVLAIQTEDGRTDFSEQDSGHNGVTIYMPSPVNGLVLGPDGKPVANAKVTAQVNERGAQTFTTDAFGQFTIASPGLKRNSAIMAHCGNLGTASPVFYEGDDITLRLTSGNLCVITGQIVNTDGAPVPNIDVSLLSSSSTLNGIIEDTQTDAQGRYAFDPIYSNAKYCVEPRTDGYNHPNSDDFNAAANQSIQVPTLTIVLTDAFAGGTVVDNKGQPVPNVNVTDQDTGTSATTDQAGHFMLKGVPRGKTHVGAVSPQETYGNEMLTSNRGDNIIYLKKLEHTVQKSR